MTVTYRRLGGPLDCQLRVFADERGAFDLPVIPVTERGIPSVTRYGLAILQRNIDAMRIEFEQMIHESISYEEAEKRVDAMLRDLRIVRIRALLRG